MTQILGMWLVEMALWTKHTLEIWAIPFADTAPEPQVSNIWKQEWSPGNYKVQQTPILCQ